MRHGWTASALSALAGAGLALAQPPATPGRVSVVGPPAATAPAAPGTAHVAVPAAPGSAHVAVPAAPIFDPGPSEAAPEVAIGGEWEGHGSGRAVFLNLDYMLWFIQDAPSQLPLATTGPAGGFAALGDPGTSTLIGGEDIDYNQFSGLRLTAGVWRCHDFPGLGFEVSAFLLEQRADGVGVASAALPSGILGRPFLDANLGVENVRLLGLPGSFDGGISVENRVRFWGAELTPVLTLYRNRCFRFDATAGARYLDLDESMTISDTSRLQAGGLTTFAGGVVAAPGLTLVSDRFFARNHFTGGTLGGRFVFDYKALSVTLSGSVALGGNVQTVNIDGDTTLLTATTPPAVVRGGLLTTVSNISRNEMTEFAVVPEVGVKVCYCLTSWLKASLGYNVIYINDVVRPGDQVDRTVNLAGVPTSPTFGMPGGPARPAPRFDGTSFTAHGLSLGLGVTY
jgi:hypothetical protein